MAFDINWNKSSANDIAASIDRAKAALTKTAAPAMQQTNSSGQAQLPSWMGNMYSNVPGTDWYSTNPSNPNASKYRADGSPVATVGYDNQQTGQSYHGYATPEQFKQIMGGANNAAATSGLVSGMISSGQLNMPQSSIYNSNGGYAKTAVPAQMVASAKTAAPNMSSDPFAPLTPGYMQGGSKTQTAAPAMAAMSRWNVGASAQERLARFQSNPNDAQNELLALKQMYAGANGNPARQAEISGWADQVRQAAGIRDSNATFGNNNGETPAQQQANIDLFTKSQNATGPVTGTGGTTGGVTGAGGAGIGTGTGAAGTGQTVKTGTPNDLYQDPYARTPESIAALAKSRIDAILQGGRTAAAGSLTNAKNANDYTNQIKTDNRVLEDFTFKNRNDPFSGNTSYLTAQNLRNRSIQDTAQNKDYNAQVSQIQQKLADLEAAAPGQQQQIIDDLQQIERTTGINVAQLQEQQKNNQFNQMDANRKFDYGVGQDALKNANDLKKQHIDLANFLTQQYGVPVYPTDDPMLSYAQVAGIPTVAAQKIAMDAKQMSFDNAVKKALAENTINKTQADIMQQAQQIGISQQNANTSSASQGTSADRLAWEKSQAANKPKDYKTDPNFASDVAHMKSNPADASKLDSNAQPFIDAYGYDGYLALRKAAGLDQ